MAEVSPKALWVKIQKGGGPGGVSVEVYANGSGSDPIVGEEIDVPDNVKGLSFLSSNNPTCFWYNGRRYCR